MYEQSGQGVSGLETDLYNKEEDKNKSGHSGDADFFQIVDEHVSAGNDPAPTEPEHLGPVCVDHGTEGAGVICQTADEDYVVGGGGFGLGSDLGWRRCGEKGDQVSDGRVEDGDVFPEKGNGGQSVEGD